MLDTQSMRKRNVAIKRDELIKYVTVNRKGTPAYEIYANFERFENSIWLCAIAGGGSANYALSKLTICVKEK